MNSNLSNSEAGHRQVIRNIYYGIKDRCYRQASTSYESYGGRGIGLWEPWREDSSAFVDWILQNLGPRPADPPGWASRNPYWSIDRLDVNGNYEPSNIRKEWASPSVQMSNTRAQLDPMNGIKQTPGASTWGYAVTRDGEKFAEYGFETPEDAAAGRDQMLQILDNEGADAARKLIQDRTSARTRARQAEIDLARQAATAAKSAAQAAKDAATKAKKEAREARKLASEIERQTRRDEKAARHAGRAARYHELNKTMTLADIARAEGVSVALVSTELRRFGYEAVLHNSTGYPGVKQVTKNGRTYYVARISVGGKRKDLGQRKTAEEAYELILKAKELVKVPQRSEDSRRSKRRTVTVRAA
jgi:hypothetical protein